MRTRRGTMLVILFAVLAILAGGAIADEPGGPLTVDLVVDHAIPRGDKTTYYLKATMSGGAPPYYFAWQNATPNVANTVNPNTAVRTCLNTQSVTVKVYHPSAPGVYDTVTIGGGIR